MVSLFINSVHLCCEHAPISVLNFHSLDIFATNYPLDSLGSHSMSGSICPEVRPEKSLPAPKSMICGWFSHMRWRGIHFIHSRKVHGPLRHLSWDDVGQSAFQWPSGQISPPFSEQLNGGVLNATLRMHSASGVRKNLKWKCNGRSQAWPSGRQDHIIRRVLYHLLG